jgi:hypothetical protein
MRERTMPISKTTSSVSKPPEESTFIVTLTNCAAYLFTIGKPYLGARLTRDRDAVEFMFDNREENCMEAVIAFRSHTAKHVDPLEILDAHGFLRSEVKRILSGVRNAK